MYHYPIGLKNNNLLNIGLLIEFNDGYKLPVTSIIDTGASRNYISEEIVPKHYREEAVTKSMVRDAFVNQIILSEKLTDCTISINNQKYTLPLTWVKPFNKEKTTQFILGMNFIKNQSGGLIV